MALQIKQHDTRPVYVTNLKDNFGLSNEAPINLTTATQVTFKMRLAGAPDQAAKVSRVCQILSAANGQVQHIWQASDTDTVGVFNVEFEILWNDGGIETVPNGGYNTVEVVQDLDL